MVQVETYECEETASGIGTPEMDQEAIILAESMGLEGQAKFTCKTAEEGQVRCPYRKITVEENFVYRVLCPKQTKLHLYDESPIPLRVLQVISHAQTLNFFEEYEIWSANGVVKDPVLVAYDEKNTWNAIPYILARWGEELSNLQGLMKTAMTRRKEYLKNEVNECISKANLYLNRIDSLSDPVKLLSEPHFFY